jgi:hypothetical protein
VSYNIFLYEKKSWTRTSRHTLSLCLCSRALVLSLARPGAQYRTPLPPLSIAGIGDFTVRGTGLRCGSFLRHVLLQYEFTGPGAFSRARDSCILHPYEGSRSEYAFQGVLYSLSFMESIYPLWWYRWFSGPMQNPHPKSMASDSPRSQHAIDAFHKG